MTIACGDSHTSTHGALGAVAFGIGTSQVRDVLASQSLAMSPLKVRRIAVDGGLAPGVFAKDVVLRDHSPARREGRRRPRLRVRRRGHRRHEHRRAADRLQHVDRGRRAGRLREPRRNDVRIPARAAVRPRGARRSTGPSRGGARWPRTRGRTTTTSFEIDGSEIEPRVTWGINPGQSVGVTGRIPAAGADGGVAEALEFMGLTGGDPIRGTRIDVAFVGVLHQLAPVGPARGGAHREGAAGGAPRQGAGGARLPGGARGGRGGGASTKCSARLGSSGAGRGARCAWP